MFKHRTPFHVRSLVLGSIVLYGGLACAASLDPPSLRCASVINPAGDVDVTWVVPPDPNNEFQSYVLFTSPAIGGPYNLLTQQFTYGTNSYSHVGAGANVGPQFYFLKTISTSLDTSLASDTLSTIFLSVSQSTPLGSAVLDWTAQHVPPIATANAQLAVQLEHPIGTWSQVDLLAVTAHHYEQLISICQDSLTYRIALQNQLGCTSYSNLAGDVFSDVTSPSPPVMVTLSVDTSTNQTVIDWDPSPQDDTNGYIIVLVLNGNNVIVDTVYGQSNTSYVWSGSDAGLDVESYTIAAFDTCYHGNPAAPNTSATLSAHSTVYVRTVYDRCAADVTVIWTPYVGWPVTNYELFVSVDNGPPLLLGTFPSTVHSFSHEGVLPFKSYCYVVRAVGSTPLLVSLSNKVCRTTNYPSVPQWNYLRNATVVEPDHVLVVDSVDLSAKAYRYRLERTFNGQPWEEITTAPGGVSPTITFDDLDVITAERSYTYRIIVEDSCGIVADTSNTGTSILLLVEPGIDGINRLRWNGYVQWAGPVVGYTVYRSIGDGAFMPIAFNPPDMWELDDDVNSYIASNGRFCYFVEANESGNPSGINSVSMSNEVCAIQQEAVWIPNAFIAGGANDSFKPVLAFVDVKGYELIIYNRWGQEIWSTTDPDMTWDGKLNDFYVPQGVYAYYCAFHNGAGKKFEERGTVTFLCCPN